MSAVDTAVVEIRRDLLLIADETYDVDMSTRLRSVADRVALHNAELAGLVADWERRGQALADSERALADAEAIITRDGLGAWVGSLVLERVRAVLAGEPPREPCHICGEPRDKPGKMFCSASHGLLGEEPLGDTP